MKAIDYYTFSSCLLTQVPPTSPAKWTWGQRAVQGTAWQIPVCIVTGSQGLGSQTNCKTGWRSQCIIFLSSRGKEGIIHLLITFNQSPFLWLYLITPYHDPSLTTVILRLQKVTVASPVGCYSPPKPRTANQIWNMNRILISCSHISETDVFFYGLSLRFGNNDEHLINLRG